MVNVVTFPVASHWNSSKPSLAQVFCLWLLLLSSPSAVPPPLRRDPSLRQETATVRGRAQVKHSTYPNVIVVFAFVVIGNSVAGVLKRISCLLQVFFLLIKNKKQTKEKCKNYRWGMHDLRMSCKIN